MVRYTDFLVNEIDEDGKVVHLTSLEYKGRGKQQTGAGDDQKKEMEKGTEKQEKKDEVDSAKQDGTPAPAPAPVKEFEVIRVSSNSPNVRRH